MSLSTLLKHFLVTMSVQLLYVIMQEGYTQLVLGLTYILLLFFRDGAHIIRDLLHKAPSGILKIFLSVHHERSDLTLA